jgi:hypothetical protein
MAKKAEVMTAAALLVKEHGDDAWLEASSKATDHKAAGDLATSQFWAHVADAIAAMSGPEETSAPSYKH